MLRIKCKRESELFYSQIHTKKERGSSRVPVSSYFPHQIPNFQLTLRYLEHLEVRKFRSLTDSDPKTERHKV